MSCRSMGFVGQVAVDAGAFAFEAESAYPAFGLAVYFVFAGGFYSVALAAGTEAAFRFLVHGPVSPAMPF